MKRQLAAVGKLPSKKQSVVFNWRKMVVGTTGDAGNWAEMVGTLARISWGRNLLAHGIASTSANPWTQNSAFVDCIDVDGKTHRLTVNDLQSLL